jgi:hypothetical protein
VAWRSGASLLVLEPPTGTGGVLVGVDDVRGRLCTLICTGSSSGGRWPTAGGGSSGENAGAATCVQWRRAVRAGSGAGPGWLRDNGRRGG